MRILIFCQSTFHRSQGLTLCRVEADLTDVDVWEAGQAYVALSRAPDPDGLQIVNFPATEEGLRRVVCASPQALDATAGCAEWVGEGMRTGGSGCDQLWSELFSPFRA